MRLLVLLEPADDVRIPPRRDLRSGRLRPEWQVRRSDPACARALDLALALKAAGGEAGVAVEVVAATLGPEEGEAVLREALARGCDEVVRVWDAECRGLRAPGKAVVLAAVARAARCDLVLAGASSAATASAQVGVLVAEHLGPTCVTQAAELAPGAVSETPAPPVRVTRGLAEGFRESVEVSLPAVVTVLPGELDVTPAPLSAILDAHVRAVPVWDLAELGVSPEQVRGADRSILYGRLRTPRPAVRRVPAPDPTAPAFDRIGGLVRGTVQRREGRVSVQAAEDLADEVFQALREGGWLDHLRGTGAE